MRRPAPARATRRRRRVLSWQLGHEEFADVVVWLQTAARRKGCKGSGLNNCDLSAGSKSRRRVPPGHRAAASPASQRPTGRSRSAPRQSAPSSGMRAHDRVNPGQFAPQIVQPAPVSTGRQHRSARRRQPLETGGQRRRFALVAVRRPHRHFSHGEKAGPTSSRMTPTSIIKMLVALGVWLATRPVRGWARHAWPPSASTVTTPRL